MMMVRFERLKLLSPFPMLIPPIAQYMQRVAPSQQLPQHLSGF